MTEGKAEIDGLEISKYRTEALRKQIGVVPQKAVLFSGTIKSNLQMGNEQASEQEMYAALKNRTGFGVCGGEARKAECSCQ